MDEKQTVARALGEGQVLGREQDSGTGIADVSQEASQNHHALGIQPHRRFVYQNVRDVQGESGGHSDLSAEAVRELAEAGLVILEQSERLEHDLRSLFVAGARLPVEVPVEVYVL